MQDLVQITTNLPASDVQALRQRAESEYRTLSAEIRRLVSLSLTDARISEGDASRFEGASHG